MSRSAFLLGIVLLLLLGAMAAVPMLEQPPALRTHNHPGQFDAVRAKARLAFILGQQPHPADSAADDDVRTRLTGTLRQMGLQPVERDQFACNELFKVRGVSCARVRNVIARLGPAGGKALLLNAHYDSVPAGPGASDDGMGVATLLEVAAILKDRQLQRPLVLLFNEGEELGLVGARAFLADPMSRNIDSLINLEARGVRGPVNMFETSRPNGAPIALFAAAVKHPTANSLSTDVYRLMPNYTDVNSFSERGWLTFNLAPIGNETRYHSPGDDIAALDLATLQHMGDQTLALADALVGSKPTADPHDRIFMDVSGRVLISMPLIAGAAVMALLLLAFAVVAAKRGRFAIGAAVVVPTILLSAGLAWLIWAIIEAVRPGMFWRAEPEWTHVATYAGVLFVSTTLLASIANGVTTRQLRAAYWLVFLAAGALIGLLAPGGIVFFLFPPLIALAGIIASRWWNAAERTASLLAIVFLYLTWGAMIGLLQELLNGGPMWVFAPLSALLLLPAMIEIKPLIDAANCRTAAAASAILVLLGWAAAAAAPAYSADRQQRFVIQHVTDAASGKSWLSVVNDHAPLPRAFGAGWTWAKLPFGDSPRWIRPAAADASSKAPVVQLVRQWRSPNSRTLLLRLSMNGNDDVELIAPEDAAIRTAGVPDFIRPIEGAKGKYYIGCSGRSCDKAAIQLITAQSGPIHLLVLGSRHELPASAATLVAARPRFARPQYLPDEAIAFDRVKL